ncbi:MAG: hypothetical protein KY439_01225 [Actinobacteria bacterium]|nr:hypothetical protein [Actinomycetota bacterium]
MTTGRLVKVMLPGHLVAAMDAFINRSPDYAGRAEVLTDALDGFLTEIGATAPVPLTLPLEEAAPSVALRVEPLAPVLAAAVLELHPAPAGVPVVEPVSGLPRREFTWGMHNRDFPTLWAALHLATATAAAGAPLPFAQWVPSLARDAWRVALGLAEDRTFDLSGFPTNPAKWAKAETRFITFFVGAADGTGPLFDLALAGMAPDGTCGLTEAGVTVLGALDGWGCSVDATPTDARRVTWLGHLAQWAPADIDLFAVVVDAIDAGSDTRDSLLLAVAERYEDWSSSQVSTNAAAAVSRLREVGLLERRQSAGRYVLAGTDSWAAAEIDRARPRPAARRTQKEIA